MAVTVVVVEPLVIDCDLRRAGRSSHWRSSGNDTVHDFGRITQRIAGKVGIALRRAGVCMTKQSLHDIERHTFVNQEACKRVSQVVKSHIL